MNGRLWDGVYMEAYNNPSIKRILKDISFWIETHHIPKNTGFIPMINKHSKDYSSEVDKFLDIDENFFLRVHEKDFFKIICHDFIKNFNISSYSNINDISEKNGFSIPYILRIYKLIILKELIGNKKIHKNFNLKKTLFGWKIISYDLINNKRDKIIPDYYEKYFK